MCSFKVMRQTKIIISLLQECPWQPNIAEWWLSLMLLPVMSHDTLITWPCETRGSLTAGGSTRKRLSRHRLLVFHYLNLFYSVETSFDKLWFRKQIFRDVPWADALKKHLWRKLSSVHLLNRNSIKDVFHESQPALRI